MRRRHLRRRHLVALIGLGIVVFLAISALLTRAFSVSGIEYGAVTSLVQDEARGDAGQMIAAISGCRTSAACRARTLAEARTLKRSGSLSIVDMQASAGFSLGSTLGTARVAWVAGSALPVVQCVRVRHAGDVLSGFRVELLALSPRISSDADCPARFG